MAKFKALPYSHRADLFESLANLESAGIPIDVALGTIKLAEPIPQRITQMRKHIANNKDVANAGKLSGVFTALEADLIRVAFSTGSPLSIYKRLSHIYGQRAKLVAHFKSQMTAPILLIFLSIVAQALLESLKDGSQSLFWNIFRPALGLFVVVFLVSRFKDWLEELPNSNLRASIEGFLISAPYISYFVIKQNTTHFFESLGLMLEGGLTLQESLPKASQTMGNLIIRKEFEKILPQVKKDKTLSEAMKDLKFIENKNLLGLIIVGEKSGTLPLTLSRFAASENDKISLFLESASKWIPKIAYALVSAYVLYNLLFGNLLGIQSFGEMP